MRMGVEIATGILSIQGMNAYQELCVYQSLMENCRQHIPSATPADCVAVANKVLWRAAQQREQSKRELRSIMENWI